MRLQVAQMGSCTRTLVRTSRVFKYPTFCSLSPASAHLASKTRNRAVYPFLLLATLLALLNTKADSVALGPAACSLVVAVHALDPSFQHCTHSLPSPLSSLHTAYVRTNTLTSTMYMTVRLTIIHLNEHRRGSAACIALG